MKRNSRLGGDLAAVLSLVFSCSPALASIEAVTVEPANPRFGDTIYVSVEGLQPDGCWAAESFECLPCANDTIRINTYNVDGWTFGVTCSDCSTPYIIPMRPYPDLPAGEYVVVVTEYHDSPRLPDPEHVTVPFTISSVTAAERTTWGRLRALSR